MSLTVYERKLVTQLHTAQVLLQKAVATKQLPLSLLVEIMDYAADCTTLLVALETKVRESQQDMQSGEG